MFEKTIKLTVVDTEAPETTAEQEEYQETVQDATISKQLDVIIEGEQAIYNALYIIIGIACGVIVIKFVWTLVAKWFFGGV